MLRTNVVTLTWWLRWTTNVCTNNFFNRFLDDRFIFPATNELISRWYVALRNTQLQCRNIVLFQRARDKQSWFQELLHSFFSYIQHFNTEYEQRYVVLRWYWRATKNVQFKYCPDFCSIFDDVREVYVIRHGITGYIRLHNVVIVSDHIFIISSSCRSNIWSSNQLRFSGTARHIFSLTLSRTPRYNRVETNTKISKIVTHYDNVAGMN